MPRDLLQALLDPRAWFAFGILFFGGFVLMAEVSQRRDTKKPPEPLEPKMDDGNE
jgi:hypothetical protein